MTSLWVILLCRNFWNTISIYTSSIKKCYCIIPENMYYEYQITTFFLMIILLFLTSFLISIVPLRKLFKKAGEKPRYTLIPIQNLYILFRIASSRILFLFLLAITLILFNIFTYYHPMIKTSCCSHSDILWLSNAIMIMWSLAIVIIILTLYRLARKFSWKPFPSILFILFFPIWIRFLWFGNYEYIWNKKSENNLKSK